MKILLAIDGSEQSAVAVDEVCDRHFPPDSDVRVISVVEPMTFAGSLPGEFVNADLYVELEKSAQERAHTAVDTAVDKLRTGAGSRQFKVTTAVPSGSPKREILEEAEKFAADLIVVGSHGHGGFERFLLGSVSQAVALHARCSVEIVRSRKALPHANKKS